MIGMLRRGRAGVCSVAPGVLSERGGVTPEPWAFPIRLAQLQKLMHHTSVSRKRRDADVTVYLIIARFGVVRRSRGASRSFAMKASRKVTSACRCGHGLVVANDRARHAHPHAGSVGAAAAGEVKLDASVA